MTIDALREMIQQLGEASAAASARAWRDGSEREAAYFEGEVQRSLEILAIIDGSL